MIFLLWCVFGGFLLHFFESLLLDILLKKNYEKPVDTAEDVVNRGLGVIKYMGTESVVETQLNSPFYNIRTLAERTTVAKVVFS